MSTLFETSVLFSIFTFHSDLQNEFLDRERTEKTFREAIFERHYFICLQNKCMRQCMTGLRTDGRTYVRTYGHDVITKFSELHGLLPFSLTNGAPQAAFGRWSSAINILNKSHENMTVIELTVSWSKAMVVWEGIGLCFVWSASDSTAMFCKICNFPFNTFLFQIFWSNQYLTLHLALVYQIYYNRNVIKAFWC